MYTRHIGGENYHYEACVGAYNTFYDAEDALRREMNYAKKREALEVLSFYIQDGEYDWENIDNCEYQWIINETYLQ